MKDKFLIGELSKLFNISTDTLRHYDKVDLLKPEYDRNNKYRYYSIRNFFKLSRILFLKNLDISLNDIKQYMNNKNATNLVLLLKGKEAEIDTKMNKLINLKKKISNKLEILENIKEEMNVVKIKRLPERRGIFLDTNNSKEASEIKQSFKNSAQYLKLSSWLIEGQLYSSLSLENILNKNFNRVRYFIEIVSIEDALHKQFNILPENDYACIVFSGPYRGIEKQYKVLIQWIDENGYQIVGDSIEKNIVDFDFADSEKEYVSEIQIPIH